MLVALPAISSQSSGTTEDISGSASSADERLHDIVVEYYDFVWRSLRRLGVTPPETDDAAQQVCMIVAKKFADIEEGKERPFVFGIVMRVAANARRARAKLREVPEEDAPDLGLVQPNAEASLDRAAARAALDEILGRMPDERRAVLVLSVFEELSLPEIAATLQIPVTTAAWRLKRAREELDAGIARLRARRQGV